MKFKQNKNNTPNNDYNIRNADDVDYVVNGIVNSDIHYHTDMIDHMITNAISKMLNIPYNVVLDRMDELELEPSDYVMEYDFLTLENIIVASESNLDNYTNYIKDEIPSVISMIKYFSIYFMNPDDYKLNLGEFYCELKFYERIVPVIVKLLSTGKINESTITSRINDFRRIYDA